MIVSHSSYSYLHMSNFAFIDAQNINLSIQEQWRKLDWKKLLVYLKDHLDVTKAYLFIGYIPENQKLYSFFQDLWYHLIFKPVLHLKSGLTKGNVDAELVLQAMIDYRLYEKMVLLTGDGDFACLVRYLYEHHKFARLIVPNEKKYSIFLKKAAKEKIDWLNNLKSKLHYKTKKIKNNTINSKDNDSNDNNSSKTMKTPSSFKSKIQPKKSEITTPKKIIWSAKQLSNAKLPQQKKRTK